MGVQEIVQLQFFYPLPYRWTTGFGEHYDYDSIMHYSSKAFSKDPESDGMLTIEPIGTDRSCSPNPTTNSETTYIQILNFHELSPIKLNQ